MSVIRSMLVASILAASVVLAQAQMGQGGGQGRPPTQDPVFEAKRADCRTQAAQKGLMGPEKRSQRQAFMQKCVHGTN